MLMKVCPRCGRIMPWGPSHCSECLPIVKAERERAIERKRKASKARAEARRRAGKGELDHRSDRFYHSPEWKALARRYASEHMYTCERCGADARNVHHKVDIKTPEGWEHRLDPDGLELLCIPCHNKEHGRFKGRVIPSKPSR